MRADLQAKLEDAFNADGLSLAEILEQASELVVFGSYALGKERPDSDIDVFVVGRSPRRRRSKYQKLDLVYIKPEELEEPSWLGSELAAHIAAYGIWLKGDGKWRLRTKISEQAAERKRLRILDRGKSVLENAHLIGALRLKSHIIKLRRDCQRAVLLESKTPGSCTADLDSEWERGAGGSYWFKNQLILSGFSDEESSRLVALSNMSNC